MDAMRRLQWTGLTVGRVPGVDNRNHRELFRRLAWTGLSQTPVFTVSPRISLLFSSGAIPALVVRPRTPSSFHKSILLQQVGRPRAVGLLRCPSGSENASWAGFDG